MKKYYLSLLICSFLAIWQSACKKNATVAESQELTIEKAKSFFLERISNTVESYPKQTEIRNSTISNPRKEIFKEPLWGRAIVTRLSGLNAVIVPVQYQQSFTIKNNLDGKKLYAANDVTKLIFYVDAQNNYHSELVTYLPDSNYNRTKFSGVVLVENWNGTTLSNYKFDKSGVKKLQQAQNGQSKSSTVATLTVCYEITGHNYSADDPDGTYWSEDAGCETFYFGEGDGNEYDQGQIDYGSAGSGGNGGGTTGFSPVPSPVVIAGDNIIANIQDYNKCFDNVAGLGHTYSVTLCIDQPEPGTRDTWGGSGNGSSGGNNPVDVGHTFFILTEKTPSKTVTRNVGFYPQTSVTPLSPSAHGQLNNDASNPYNISLTVTLTNSQFFSLLGFIAQGNGQGYLYNLNTNNCTTFALNGLSSIGINLPRTTGTWFNGSGLNPGDLGEDTRNMPLSSNMVRNTIYSGHPNSGTCN